MQSCVAEEGGGGDWLRESSWLAFDADDVIGQNGQSCNHGMSVQAGAQQHSWKDCHVIPWHSPVVLWLQGFQGWRGSSDSCEHRGAVADAACVWLDTIKKEIEQPALLHASVQRKHDIVSTLSIVPAG